MAGLQIDYDLKTMQQVEACGYEAIQRKGRGTYGFVYEVGDARGDLFAFKYILPDVSYETLGLDSLNEIDILSRVDHPYIIHAAKIITAHNCEIDGLAVVLPLADRTLFDIIRDPHITTDDKLPILYKLATALEFLHRNNILHLDIKATNVVLQGIAENHPYLIDFGLSMVVDDIIKGKYDSSTRVTIDHRAPEILAGSRIYNSAVDIWAFGIMMLYILSGQGIFNVDFSTITPAQLNTTIINMFTDPTIFDRYLAGVRDKYRPFCKDLLSRILQVNPNERLTARQICDHPLFDQFRIPVDGFLIEPYIPHDYSDDHRDILKILIHWATTIYHESRAELLFLAVDLFNRTSSFYTKRTPLDRMTLAATCLWVAAKLTDSKLIPLDVFVPSLTTVVKDITSTEILKIEIEIIHLLNGIFNISKLYHSCTTAEQLRLSLHHVILSRDTNTYAQTDIPAWLEVMKHYTKDVPNTDKNITISELLPR